MFALELLVDLFEPLVRLLDLTDGLFGDLQPRLKFGVLLEGLVVVQCGGHGAKYTAPAAQYNIK